MGWRSSTTPPPPHPENASSAYELIGYEAGLRRRGYLKFWVDEGAMAKWRASRRATRGGQMVYAEAAVEPVLTLGSVFYLALRKVEDFARSVVRLLGWI